ncbi:MAG: hypothetical protein Q8910_00210 [Bacteroidota bacterium]|nr:hypothetical protein [Bacteroidota bacterium]
MTALYYEAVKLYDNAATQIKELSIQLAFTPKENWRERRSIKAKIDRWKKKRDLYHLQWFLLAEEEKQAI